MTKSKLYILLVLLLWVASMGAQNPIVRTFSKFKNFRATHIYDIDQNSEGYIYISSNKGIYQFNGSKFRNISKENGLVNNKFTNIFIDKDNQIWVSETNARTWRIDNGKLILQKSSKPFPKSLLAPIKGTYHKTGDTLSFITYSQSHYKFINDTLYEHKKINIDHTIFHIIKPFNIKWRQKLAYYLQVNQDKFFQDKRYKMGYTSSYSNDSSFILCSGNLMIYNKNEDIKHKIEDKSYYCAISVDKYNLIGKQNEGLIVLRGKTPIDTLLDDVEVTELFADANNGIWVGTQSDGIMYIPSLDYIVHKPNYDWGHSLITDIQYLNNQIISLEKHQKLKAFNITDKHYSHKIKLPIKAKELVYENNSTIIAFGEYQAVIIQNSNNLFSIVQHFELRNPIYKVAINANQIFFASLNGITIYNIFNKKIIDTIIINERFKNLCEWNNKIYAGNNNGLWEINENLKVEKISSNEVQHMNSTPKELIICYENNKLEIKSPTSNKIINLKQHISINHIFKKDTLILLSTENGLKALDKKFALSNQYNHFNKTLSNNNILRSFEINNKIFLLTKSGFYIFPNNRPRKKKNHPIQFYSQNIIKKDGKQNTLIIDKDVRHLHLLLSTFDYKSITPPTLYYKINNEKTINRIQNNELNITQLSTGISNIEISDNVNFYENHNYLNIKIQKTGYWYQNIYGQLLIIVIISIILVITIRYRLNIIKRKNAYENSRVTQMQTVLQQQMNPHFIFNSLTSINHFVLQNKPMDSSRYLTKFSTLIRNILDNSNSEKILLSEELETINLYLELELLRFMGKFSFNVKKSHNVNENIVKIVPFLLQPYIDKAIKQNILNKSGKGTIILQIQIIKNYLVCDIIDNGINIDNKEREEGTYNNKSRFSETNIQITKQRIKNHNKQNRYKIVITNEVLKNHQNETIGNKTTIKYPLNQ